MMSENSRKNDMRISSVAPPVKIDISIRRCRKELNQKQHLLNFSGNHFEMPKNCKNHNNSRYQCNSISFEDAMEIRQELYKTTDRNLLAEKLKSSWITIITPKRHTTTENSKVAKVMTIFYKFPKINQKEVTVCREMFLATTGISKSRFQTLIKKVYKKELLEQNIDFNINLKKSERKTLKAQRLEELVTAKKEKLLSLEKGTYKEFEKVIKGNSMPEENLNVEYTEEVSDSIIQYMEDDEVYYEEESQVYSELNQLDLQLMETCRICLQSNENLKPIFGKSEEEEYQTFAQMIEYGLSLEIMQDDSLPNKICENCAIKVRSACELKFDLLESQEMMAGCLQEKEETYCSQEDWEDPNMQEVIVQYQDEEFMETEDIEEAVKSTKFEIEQNVNSRKLDAKHSRAEKCYLCDVNFENESDVEHFQKNHKEIKLTRCKLCMFETEYMYFLNLHYQIHQDDFRLCGTCGIKCESREKYHSHKRGCERKRVPKEDRIKYNCSECPAVYYTKSSFKVHEMIHTQETPGKYTCEYCKAAFYQKMGYKQHLLTHGVDPDFRCKYCSKGFLVKYRLLQHESRCSEKRNYDEDQ